MWVAGLPVCVPSDVAYRTVKPLTLRVVKQTWCGFPMGLASSEKHLFGDRSRRWCALGLVLCEIALGGACSMLVDSDRQQCVVNSDCASSEPGFADALCIENVCQQNPTWACIGNVTWPTPEPKPATVVIRLRELV